MGRVATKTGRGANHVQIAGVACEEDRAVEQEVVRRGALGVVLESLSSSGVAVQEHFELRLILRGLRQRWEREVLLITRCDPNGIHDGDPGQGGGLENVQGSH